MQGSDLIAIPSDGHSQISVDKCCPYCDVTYGCVAFSWANGVCYLKQQVTQLVDSKGASTGILGLPNGNNNIITLFNHKCNFLKICLQQDTSNFLMV